MENYSKEIIDDLKGKIEKDLSRFYLKEGWAAYHMLPISEAKNFRNKLIDLINKEKRQATREEKDFINTINEEENKG